MDKDDLLQIAHAEAFRIIEESPAEWLIKEYPQRYEIDSAQGTAWMVVSLLRYEGRRTICVSAYESRHYANQPTSSCALIPLNKDGHFLSRQDALRCVQAIASELEKGTFNEWVTRDFPIAYESDFEGHEIQVEIIHLETTPNYLQLGVSVDNGGIMAYSPPSISVIIPRNTE